MENALDLRLPRCEICEKSCQSQQSLEAHIQGHFEDRCMCVVCHTKFGSPGELERHDCFQASKTSVTVTNASPEQGLDLRKHVDRSGEKDSSIFVSTGMEIVHKHSFSKVEKATYSEVNMTSELVPVSLEQDQMVVALRHDNVEQSYEIADILHQEIDSQANKVFKYHENPVAIDQCIYYETDSIPATPSRSAPEPCHTVHQREKVLTTGLVRKKFNDMSERTYDCDVCGRRCGSASGLKSHMSVHKDREHISPERARSHSRQPLNAGTNANKTPRKNVGYRTGVSSRSDESNKQLVLYKSPSTLLQRYPHRCTICSRVFAKKSSLDFHSMMHFNDNPLEYDVDEEQPDSRWDVDEDSDGSPGGVDVIHPPPIMVDVGDYGEFDDELNQTKPDINIVYDSGLADDAQTHDGGGLGKPHSCVMCGIRFAQESSLEKHVRSHFQDGPQRHKCDICPETFSSAVSMRMHRRIHSGRPPFDCEWCNNSYSSAKGLWKHFVHCHEKDYINDQSGKVSTDGDDPCSSTSSDSGFSKLKEVKTEPADDPIKIAYDNLQIVDAQNDVASMEIPSKLWKCQYCEKKFTSRTVLVRHRKNHRKKWKFPPKRSLHTELQRYVGKKNSSLRPGDLLSRYRCGICGRTFMSARGVKIHQFWHKTVDDADSDFVRGDHKCLTCGKHFARKVTFTRHLSQCSSGTRCSMCGANFSSAVALRIHKRTHTTGQMFRCEACPARYLTKAALNLHKDTVHDDDDNFQLPGTGKNSLELTSRNDSIWEGMEVTSAMYRGDSDGTDSRRRNDSVDPNNAAIKEEFIQPPSSQPEAAQNPESRGHQCPVCDRLFASSRGLNIHMSVMHCQDVKTEVDSGENEGFKDTASEDKCFVCDATFPTKQALNVHRLYCSDRELQKDDDNANTCEFCFKSFPTIKGRKIHAARCNGAYREAQQEPEYEFKCEACPKSFPTSRGVSNHLRHCPGIDRDRQTYPLDEIDGDNTCALCDRSFPTKRGLNSHKWRCTGESTEDSPPQEDQPVEYKCRICNKSFASNQGLGNHRRHCTGHHVEALPNLEDDDSEGGDSDADEPGPLEGHISSEGEHKCSKCPKSFATSRGLGNHFWRCPASSGEPSTEGADTPEVAYPCKQCPKVFTSSRGLSIHSFYHSSMDKKSESGETNPGNDRPYKCGVCGDTFSTMQGFKIHHTLSHPTLNQFDLTIDKDVVTSQSKETTTTISPKPQVTYNCSLCGKIFYSRTGLKKHKFKIHSGPTDQTTSPSTSAAKFAENNSTTSPNSQREVSPEYRPGKRPHRCLLCPKRFSTVQGLRIHRYYHKVKRARALSHPLLKKHKCSVCAMTFSTESGLNVHSVQVHGAISKRHFLKQKHPGTQPLTHFSEQSKPHPCDQCSKSFGSERALNIHRVKSGHRKKPQNTQRQSVKYQAASTQPKAHSCDICGEKFPTRHTLYFHRIRQHKKGNKNITSPQQSPTSGGGGDRYQCSICNNHYSTTKALNLHRLMKHGYVNDGQQQHHSPGPKNNASMKNPYKCAICDDSFASAVELQVHVGMHSRKIQCPICKRSFGSRKALAGHGRSHKDDDVESSYTVKCKICRKFFSNAGNLQRHMKLHREQNEYLPRNDEYDDVQSPVGGDDTEEPPRKTDDEMDCDQEPWSD